ncbi:MAG: TonB-dependent receptor, partial [Proteobacteria bacterium]|nr:TonB-dependent receptor [Pseudomonadota bacterium]
FFVSALLLWSTDIRAQDDPIDADSKQEAVEEIIVTGSRIKRRAFSSPSPIATIDRDMIAFSGQATLEETLNRMPQVIPDLGRTSNLPANGTATINLRGLGAGRTLVLLNGRRLAPSGVGSAIDVNNLPQALVERVEIITGGASTVYGSDALAGVVNFITRDDFSGLSIDASINSTAENDAEIYDLNLAFGHDLTNGRGNVTLYAGAYERKSLFASARELTRVFLQNDNSTGTLFEGGSSTTPRTTISFPRVDFGDGPSRTTFDPNGIPRAFIDPDDRYNFQEVNYLQIPLSRYTGGVMATFELHNGYELYLESSFSHNETAGQAAPVPAITFALVNTDNPVLTPEARQLFIDNFEIAPGLADILVGRRLLEIGPRIGEHDRDYWRTVVGVRRELGNGWDIDGWVTYTKSSEKEFFLNFASASRLLQGLLVDPVTGECFDPSNGCVPVDIFGEGRMSEEAAAFLRITAVQNDTERVQKLASVVVTGTPLDIWAGPLDIAFGLEWRSDDASFKADDVLFTGDALGFRGDAPVEGTEKVAEIYTEAIIPLAQDASWADYLGLELGARYSEYDNAGGVWTYKAGGEWQPFGSLRFRGMHQRSVRAPNNLELFQKLFTETFAFVNDSSDDPCSASNDPVAAGNTEKCVLQGLDADQVGIFEASLTPTDFVQGGNPNLVPEVAKTWTIGAVITPEALPNWTISIDYFQLEVTDSIGDIDAVSICFDPKNTSNLFCENITRDPNAGGNIVEIFEPQSNRGLIGTKGVDTQINYQADLPAGLSLFDGNAQISVNLVWTHTLENRWQLNPVTQIVDCAGFFGFFCSIGIEAGVGQTLPKNRVTTHVSYASGPLRIHLTSRWIDGTTNAAKMEAQFFGFPEPLLAIPSIGSKHYLDLGFGYEFNDNITARFGINNLADTDAPNMADAVVQNNTDSMLYDVFGRSFYLSVSAQFLN